MQTAKQKERCDQNIANRRLLSAVVALALRDACHIHGIARLAENTRSAFNFIFMHSDGYLHLLDIDPDQFRNRLIEMSFKDHDPNKKEEGYALTSVELRRFANNYQVWYREQRQLELVLRR